MSNNNTRNNPKGDKPRERTIELRKSYDTIPQPTGKFKDLFRQIQEKRNTNDSPSNVKNKPSN